MDQIHDIESNLDNNSTKNSRSDNGSGWKNIVGLFFIQFLLSQLFLSYGVYSVYLEKLEDVAIHDLLWSPLIFVSVWKICRPWSRDIAESFNEKYFRLLFFFGTMSCFVGVAFNFSVNSLIFRTIFYGGLAGLGTSLTTCLIESRLFDIFQYQSTLLYSMKHLSASIGLFVTPHLINFMFYLFYHTKIVFLYHAAILLHLIPASFFIGKISNQSNEQRLSRYSYYFGHNEPSVKELTDISEVSRNWRSPSDRVEELFENHEDLEHEIPAPHVKCTMGVEIMPEIIEENEEEEEEAGSKKNDIIKNDIKRLSVISSKLEEIIEREPDKQPEVIFSVGSIENNMNIESSATLFRDKKKPKKKHKICCCSPIQRIHLRRRIKNFFDCLAELMLKPLISSTKVYMFYPCLITVIHSMLSPLIFLNFIPIKANDDWKYGNMTEVSFMLSITAFAYICFLVTIPWVAEISKRSMRYLYIIGLIISMTALYLMKRSDQHNYITVGCLVYGFGFGIEAYCQEIIVKEYLGVRNWSKVEGTLDTLSGVLLIPILIITNNVFAAERKIGYTNKLFAIIMYSHFIVMMLWIIFPLIGYFMKYLRNKKKNQNTYNFMQHNLS